MMMVQSVLIESKTAEELWKCVVISGIPVSHGLSSMKRWQEAGKEAAPLQEDLNWQFTVNACSISGITCSQPPELFITRARAFSRGS